MAAGDALPIPRRNVAYRLTFEARLNTGALNTTGTGMDTELSGDAGTFADASNEAIEIATNSGVYYIDLTAGEMNFDTVVVKTIFTNTNAIPSVVVLNPQELGDIRVNANYWNDTAVATPATAGIPDVNVKNMNNVSASGVTAVNANQGTTQPVNFTGTGASATAKSDLVNIAGAAVSTSTAQLGVNAVQLGGTVQTGRDVGASVLLSPGTGVGQLDITSGVVKANLVQILATALTETAGQIAAAFKQFFDVATPTGTMKAITNVVTTTTATNLTNAPTAGDFTAVMKTSLNNATPSVTVSDKTGFSLSAAGIQAIWDALSAALTTAGSIGKRLVDNLTGDAFARLGAPVGASISADVAAVKTDTSTLTTRIPGTVQPQTGDSFARLGAPVGASMSADVAGVQSDTNDLQTRLPAALVGGRMDSNVQAMANNVIAAAVIATDAIGSAQLAASAVNEIADQVWDEALAGHVAAGSTGAALNAAGSAGDPWITPLPGAYGAGQAGFILGTNLDAAVSSRSTLTAIQVWQYVIEGALTAERVVRILLSAMAGKLSGVSTAVPKFRDVADTKNRISATTTADGRTSVTLDGS